MSSKQDLILVIEDNKAGSDLMAYLLRSAGNGVIPYSDGADAIEIAGRGYPRVDVMDLPVEGMSGLEAAAILAAQLKAFFVQAAPRSKAGD